MNPPPDDDPGIFASIPLHQSREAAEAMSRLRWEATVVGRLLAHYGLEHEKRILTNQCADETGSYRLLFSYFMRAHPSFPLWLCFRPVRYLHKWDMESFVDRFSKSPAYQTFLDAREEDVPEGWLEEGRPVGLVFRYINSGWGSAIMTDCERPLGENTTRLVKKFKDTVYYFEPMVSFVPALGWSP